MLASAVGYTPIFRVVKSGQDITANLQDRLVSAVYHGFSNSENSRIELIFDNRDFALSPPTNNDTIGFSLGYKEYGIVDLGEFSVDEVHYTGPPHSMKVTGFGVSLNTKMKQSQVQAFDGMNAKQILQKLGESAGIDVKVAGDLPEVPIPYMNQAGQSAFGMIDTLVRRLGGTAVFQNQQVSVIKRGGGQSAGGSSLSNVTIDIADLASYDIKINARSDFGGTTVSHWDADKLERVVKNVEATFQKTDFTQGGESDSNHIIGGMHTSEEEAKAAGEAKNDTFGRTQARIELTLAKGGPSITPQSPLTLTGMCQGANGSYTVENVTHSYTPQAGIGTVIEGYFDASGGDSGGSGDGDSGGTGDAGGGGDSTSTADGSPDSSVDDSTVQYEPATPAQTSTPAPTNSGSTGTISL